MNLQKYSELKNKDVLVSYSAGADSTALLYILNKRKETTIITVSHDGRCDYLLGDNLLKIVDGKLSYGSV